MDWKNMQNPVFEREDWSVKDAAIVRSDGHDYIFASAFYRDRGRERSHVVSWKTLDWNSFSAPMLHTDGRDEGWIGLCSPDVSQGPDGQYFLTYNSWGDKDGQPNTLFYRSSSDLENWDEQKLLANNLTSGIRCIDAALAIESTGVLLVYKEVQTPRFAIADRVDSEEWKHLPASDIGWFENAQFIKIDDTWHVLLTGHPGHLPRLYQCDWEGRAEHGFLKLTKVPFGIPPVESFNTEHQANCGFLLDWRDTDGYFYLLYAGNTERETHAGRGDNKLGLARSHDLLNWQPAGHD